MAEAARPLELWLPDLPRFEPDHPLRAWLARADRIDDGPRGFLGGLAAYFDCADGFAPAALTRELLAGDAGEATWLSADPAWIQPDLNGARLLACGQMQLGLEEARTLADALQPVFADAGMVLEVGTPDRWHVRVPPGIALPSFASPDEALGENLVQHLPEGAEGRRWRVILTEAQVLLHQHPLNAQRRERGLPPVNSLWLWGGGHLPTKVRSELKACVSDDVLLGALAARAGVDVVPRAPEAIAKAGTGWLIDLQDLQAGEIGGAWWPVLQRLAAAPLQLSFASGERWLQRPWHRLRFWRGGRR
ncbi:phosphoglycerate mutase [Dyella sp. SG609]|uniref:phosphoglycerate mutase n=1 Tax=Dyella sp. SG609 TaxID=2587018 RepID=UPI0014489FF7|nr:phosphoglycerate mutase [Dyella sp. SG609]NKJ20135.1 hypothetical protein [Dyella sp. SG609]